MKTSTAYFLVTIVGIAFSVRLVDAADEDDLALIYGDQETVSIATGSQLPLNLAPSIASVVTAEQIKNIGATDLDDVLETVPGLHGSVSPVGYNSIYQIRGITSQTNSQVLVLINGIPITNVLFGNRGQAWRGMPVENIARVEVIRGPGSAVYGADAFAGVINVMTKTANDIEGIDLGARYGTYDRKDGWVQYGGQWREFDIAFSLEAGETDGQTQNINADAQTVLDSNPMLGSTASRAPGSVNNLLRYIDTRLDVGWDDWQLRIGYQGREGGTGAGFSQALDPVGKSQSDRFNADVTYVNENLFDDWGVRAQFSFFNVSERSDLFLFPAGAAFPNSSPPPVTSVFSNGVIARPEIAERHYRADLSTDYSGFDDHKFRVGVGFRAQDLYKVKETTNYTIFNLGAGPFFRPRADGDGLTDLGRQDRFIEETDREIGYVYLQDEWDILADWILTAGIRYDHYSDFGGSVNPRFALVWQTTYNLTSKLLYGRAFRAPSFAEQFNINNPVGLGSPDLDPETIDSVELAFDYQASRTFRTQLNLYWYHYRDIIRLVQDTARTNRFDNDGNQFGYGLELEANWDIFDTLSLNANYAFQHANDDEQNDDVGFAPNHQVYARLDWEFLPEWNLNTQINWVGERNRAPSDPSSPGNDLREPLEDYTSVDLTLLGLDVWSGVGLSLAARNIFDANAKEPSPDPNLIPGDLPLAGRNFFIELHYQFR